MFSHVKIFSVGSAFLSRRVLTAAAHEIKLPPAEVRRAPQVKLPAVSGGRFMRITVCELPDDRSAFVPAWNALITHVRREASQLVLLPEMPFCSWFAGSRHFDADVWQQAITAHDDWESSLQEAAPAVVATSRPMHCGNQRYNEAFLWDCKLGSCAVHAKSLLPEEHGAWEATWYDRAAPDFAPAQVGRANVGFLIGTELWMMNQAQAYGLEHVHLLLTPRSTSAEATQTWLAAARVAAVLAGAYALSSNRFSSCGEFGGHGWIIDPDGNVMGITDQRHPCLTLDVDISAAGMVRDRYFPRYARARPAQVDQLRSRRGRWSSLQRWRSLRSMV
jgi:predicted amidohydrolase